MSALYAHVAERGWESDTDVRESFKDPETCPDAGAQLVRYEAGRKLNVLMGGGRNALFSKEELDPETGNPGRRSDGRNITAEWLASKPSTETSHYITGKKELLKINPNTTDNLIALFSEGGRTGDV